MEEIMSSDHITKFQELGTAKIVQSSLEVD